MGALKPHGYRLKAGSPCINAGAVIVTNGAADAWGSPIPQSNVNIGAHEFGGLPTGVVMRKYSPKGVKMTFDGAWMADG